MKLLIVGGGRMGEALLGGIIAAGTAASELAVVEVSAARREALVAAYPGVTVVAAPVAADGAVLAVKPVYVGATAHAVAEAGCARVLSVAAGITTAAIEAAIGRPLPVVRAMPNTPALIGAGAAAISPGAHAGEEDLAWAEEILGAVGVVVRVRRLRWTPSPACRAPAPRTSSSWPRRWPTPASWRASRATSPRRSPSRRCSAPPACWSRATSARPP